MHARTGTCEKIAPLAGAVQPFLPSLHPQTTSAALPAVCSRCVEARCRNVAITDGFGEQLDRSTACYDETKTVIATIADACPCQHTNAYSNRR